MAGTGYGGSACTTQEFGPPQGCASTGSSVPGWPIRRTRRLFSSRVCFVKDTPKCLGKLKGMTKACQFLVPSKHPCCKATGRESCKVVRFQCCVQKLMLRCSSFQTKTRGPQALQQQVDPTVPWRRWRPSFSLNPNGTVVSKHGPFNGTELDRTMCPVGGGCTV